MRFWLSPFLVRAKNWIGDCRPGSFCSPFCCALLFVALQVPAADSEKDIPVKLQGPTTATKSDDPLARMVGALFVVGVLAVGSAFFVRRMKSRQGHRTAAPPIKILNQMHLGPKKSLAIVRVAGESVLIGITDHSISHIKSLSLLDEELPEITTKEFHKLIPNNEVTG